MSTATRQHRPNPNKDEAKMVEVYVYRVVYMAMVPTPQGGAMQVNKAEEITSTSPLTHNAQYREIEQKIAHTIHLKDQRGAAIIGGPTPQVLVMSATPLRTERLPLSEMNAALAETAKLDHSEPKVIDGEPKPEGDDAPVPDREAPKLVEP